MNRLFFRLTGIAIILFLMLFICSILFFMIYFNRNDLPKNNVEIRYSEINNANYPREKVKFISGKESLQGYIYNKDSKKGIIIFAHGIENGADTYLTTIMYFVDQGWSVFAFDGTGSRMSSGDGINGLSQTKLDLESAIHYIETRKEFENIPKLLYGHSMGGYAVTSILSKETDVQAVVSLAPFDTPNEMMAYQAQKYLGFFSCFFTPFLILQNSLIFGQEANTSAVTGINSVDIPVLIIFGTEDEVVPPDKVGIYAHRREITNQNVTFYSVNEKYRNKHMTLWLDKEAAQYSLYIWKEYDLLKSKYGFDIPDKVFHEHFSNLDILKMNQIDLDLLNKINLFYQNAIKKDKS